MSLILEALRKSEAERRRGLAPDLFVELPPVVRQRASGLTPVLWALAVAVLAISAWMTRAFWSPTPDTGVAAVATVPDATTRTPSRERSAAGPAAVVAIPRSTSNVGSPLAGAHAPPSVTVPAPPTVAPAPLPQPTAPAALPPPAPVREPTFPKATPQRGPDAQPEQAIVPPASDNATTLELADLSAEQRKQLPPLRISMHMWDQDPARRFVIIDGARLGQGDRIGDAVIQQITADSVLLDWNGRRLRLPLLR